VKNTVTPATQRKQKQPWLHKQRLHDFTS